MKQLIKNYTFNAAGKTITLTDFGTVALDRLQLITNVTRNTILYNFADSETGATVSTNVITLVGASTTGMSNGDKLQIIYDCATGDPLYDSVTQNVNVGNFPATQAVSVNNFPATQPVSADSLPLPSGASSATLQTDGNTLLNNIDVNQGAVADSAASSDTGSFSLISLFKRSLQNWTTLLARIPALVSGSVPVIFSGGVNELGSTQYITGSSASGVNQDFLPATDVSGYARAIFQLEPGFVGTVQLTESNNGTNWTAIQEAYTISGGALSSNITTNGAITEIPIRARYLRARVTAYTSGTTSGQIILLTKDVAPRLMSVTQTGNWNVFLKPLVNNGQTTTALSSAASVNATLVRASQVGLLFLSANNTTASDKYVRLYAKSTAPVVGTDTPTVIITVPANSSKEINFGSYGLNLFPGFGYAITGGAGVLDNTAVAAGDVQIAYSMI